MAKFAILFTRSARKELENLPNAAVERILASISKLSSEPFPGGCKKLKGEKHIWRIRVGDYRIIYSVYPDMLVIDIIRIRHRREVYN